MCASLGGCRWLTPSIWGVNKVVLHEKPFKGGIDSHSVIYRNLFTSSAPFRTPELLVGGRLSKGNLNFRHPDPNTWKVVKIKNIYLCLPISARVPFDYWIHEPIAGQKLALISFAGFCWPRLPKHGNGSFVVIERKQNPLSTIPSCCRHLEIFILEDSHMNCT